MMADDASDRLELLDRIGALRAHVHDDIGVAALTAKPTKVCQRVVAGLLDGINDLQAVLSDER